MMQESQYLEAVFSLRLLYFSFDTTNGLMAPYFLSLRLQNVNVYSYWSVSK
jgi:hypothetical protein